jgi:1-acyl-sn-glycerol-3-phosphate acyltransferase
VILTAWAYVNAAIATLFFGSIAMVAAAFGVRGDIYSNTTQRWSKALLRGSSCGVRVHGMDRIDWSKPYVLVSNHVSAFDILAIASTMPVRFRFVAKKELERIPIFGPAWKAAGHISIDRGNRQKALESLSRAAEMIHTEGGVVVLFPEGTRSRTTELQPFKKGAFLLAVESGASIIPAIVWGSIDIMASGSKRIRPGEMDLYLGAPVSVDGYGPDQVENLIAVVRGRMEGLIEEARNSL